MEAYNQASERATKEVTNTFSTSFGMASKFFHKSIRQDIYNIYGLVRLADEIVDSYMGSDAEKVLNELEKEVYRAVKTGFSANLIVHAFAMTAKKYSFPKTLIEPFFESMRSDLTVSRHSKRSYEEYIYGSAEVVGLMCLRVFINGDEERYTELAPGAKALGAAFQKVNFLRDLAEDEYKLGRFYFPNTTFKAFNGAEKRAVEADIMIDFKKAKPVISQLPKNSKLAVHIAYVYFFKLLEKIETTNVKELKKKRVRLNNGYKLWLIFKTWATES